MVKDIQHKREIKKNKKKQKKLCCDTAKIKAKTTNILSHIMEEAGDAEKHKIMTDKQKARIERKERKAVLKREKDTVRKRKAVTEEILLAATNAEIKSHKSPAEKLSEMERLDLPASLLTESENRLLKERIMLEC